MPIMTRTKTGTIKRKSYGTITKETAVYKSKATKKTKIYEGTKSLNFISKLNCFLEADSGETYYTGNRYVPDSMDTIEWSDEETERLLGQCHTQENISVNAITNLNARCNTI